MAVQERILKPKSTNDTSPPISPGPIATIELRVPPMNAADDKAEVTRILADYYKVFSTLNLQAILPYYHQPCLLISPQGVVSAPTGAEVAAAFTPFIEGLRAKGYSRSELSKLKVLRLSATAALATGVAVRYKSDGQELDRAGVTYLLQKSDGGWKFAVVVFHDPDEDSQPG